MQQKPGPGKTLTIGDAVFVVVGIVVGAGIFKTPSLVAANAGSDGAVLVMWFAGGLASLAGALTYATFFNINFLEKASEFLTAPCFVSGLVSEEARAREAREACEKSGAEFWWYGTGCYSNPYPQESGLFFNRYGAGLFFWKTGAKSQVTWTFSRPHADPFNDFDGTPENDSEPKDQTTVYPHLLRPNDWSTYQGSIPTVAWEALREGYNDYLYLHTLAEAVKSARAGGNPRLQKRADRAEKEMAALEIGRAHV